MNKKVLVAAIAATFAAPAAFAQSSVTIGGTVNIMWDNVKASGGTIQQSAGVQSGNMKSEDRVRDGAGSNIRFSVVEDLGGGNSAFVQVESAVISNSDQRADAVGNAGATSAVWGNRNSGIGIRSKTAGRFLIGVWDVHYHEHYSIDPGWLVSNSAGSTLALTQNMGSAFGIGGQAFGTRYSNTLRWDSPVWSGFSLSVAYARPTDGAAVNSSGTPRDGKLNRVWNIAPRYESGGLSIVYSYLQDKDGVGAMGAMPTGLVGGVTAGGGPGLVALTTAVYKITSSRLGGRYKFANGFGVGLLWDQGKVSAAQDTVAATSSSIKRDVWA
ncbi:MAG: porin, partial [Burkholderiales bacterium]